MMIPEKELSPEAPEFVPASIEEKLFKIFLENNLKRTYENHFFNHLGMTSVLQKIFEQDLMKSLSVPEVVPCTLKNLNISEDANDRKSSTCPENHASTHKDFLDSDSKLESASSSIKSETSSMESEISPFTLEECRLSFGILNSMVTPKTRSAGIPICPDFLDICLQAKTSLELEKLNKEKALSSQKPKALKSIKPFQEKITWQLGVSIGSGYPPLEPEPLRNCRGLLTSYQEKSGGGSVTFGDNKKGQIKGYGVIAKKDIGVCRVAYVDGLKHNLLSVSRLCDNRFDVMFKQQYCSLLSSATGTELLRANRKDDLSRPPIEKKSSAWYLVRMRKLGSATSEEGISQNFSAARTLQQNGVVERKNRTLVEAVRTMLIASRLSSSFWAEAISKSCFTQNRSLIMKRHSKTLYHLLNQRKPNIKFFHVFGCRCFILNGRENIRKFDRKADEAKFIGYSASSTAYRIYMLDSKHILESINVSFDDSFQVTSEQISLGLKLKSYDSGESLSRANELHHFFEEMFNDDEPSEDDHIASKAKTSTYQTGTSLTGPSDTSPSSSTFVGSNVEGEHAESNNVQGSTLNQSMDHLPTISEESIPEQ
ncbi:hypothetical protein L6452_36033 [Arctium lappa]|uniref:Uncharacterized protein n=1 Tax=Arctium lappa TaxID=4217 RepID=A0ACB8Y891_ARCLA|nr:hypothetical protein L6452_36033 [Arctium lappa]